jgi:serine/threonine-protein kinase
VQLAEAHRLCADALDAWSAARAAERAARNAIEDKERTVGDLDYQIAELRRALAHHEQGIDAEHEATHRRLMDLNARVERLEAQLVQLASRFCEPLRARPELGGLFEELEAATLGATQV